MSKLLLMAATLVASNAVMATTVIDVNVMVPKSIVDQDGAEKVFNTIHQRVAAMDEYYTSQRTGIVKNGNPENLHFEVKQILVMSDTVLNPTCKTGYSAAVVLLNEKVIGVRGSYGKRPAKAVLTGATGYSAGRATRQGSSSPTRFTGQSAITFSTCRR